MEDTGSYSSVGHPSARSAKLYASLLLGAWGVHPRIHLVTICSGKLQ